MGGQYKTICCEPWHHQRSGYRAIINIALVLRPCPTSRIIPKRLKPWDIGLAPANGVTTSTTIYVCPSLIYLWIRAAPIRITNTKSEISNTNLTCSEHVFLSGTSYHYCQQWFLPFFLHIVYHATSVILNYPQ